MAHTRHNVYFSKKKKIEFSEKIFHTHIHTAYEKLRIFYMQEMIDRVNILEFKKMIYILTTKIFIYNDMRRFSF